ncbi:hypothetical protein AR158_C720R [Paramecium bursaria Chlorella virus AR158]|uniref:hypothetical protein n=1 Tax=Paramecium bursaria Chlorella virus AR158 TaxID=380598 RepID=UPI00015AA888|nr:hypothetical protein AR158_C720R [Paramecium bursaria Chlorella virus AR158]ABU44265.1 hypothetical protein AR158_C720R [Paramecium bursaria Chlorella virus AR158]
MNVEIHTVSFQDVMNLFDIIDTADECRTDVRKNDRWFRLVKNRIEFTDIHSTIFVTRNNDEFHSQQLCDFLDRIMNLIGCVQNSVGIFFTCYVKSFEISFGTSRSRVTPNIFSIDIPHVCNTHDQVSFFVMPCSIECSGIFERTSRIVQRMLQRWNNFFEVSVQSTWVSYCYLFRMAMHENI